VRDRPVRDRPRRRIGRECLGRTSKHVARELVEHDHKRERALRVVFPCAEFAQRGCRVGRQKLRLDGQVEFVVFLEPALTPGFAPERVDFGRCGDTHKCPHGKRGLGLRARNTPVTSAVTQSR